MATFREIEASKAKLLNLSMYLTPGEHRSEESSLGERPFAENSEMNAEVRQLRVPVFLNRNRRKMKQIRKHLWVSGSDDTGDL